MSTKYQKSSEVPTEVLLARVDELINAITGDRTDGSFRNEFTMRIPAEVDRDADLVLQEVADRLDKSEKVLAVSKEEHAKETIALCDEVTRLRTELTRLRRIIRTEGRKLQAHHTDQFKKQYWKNFASQADARRIRK